MEQMLDVLKWSVIVGGGNILCITQQIPEGSKKKS